MSHQRNALTELDDGITNELRLAIQNYVDAKHIIDEISWRAGAEVVAGDLMNDNGTPRTGYYFFAKTFPFVGSKVEIPAEKGFFALVPTKQVIGMTHKWLPSSVSDKAEVLEKLRLLHENDSNHIEIAEYFWIKPLGLFLAHEGQNRVALYRLMGCKHIPARIIPVDYPAAHRLKLYDVTLQGSVHWLIVLDNQYVEVLDHVNCSYPVLRAYGVEIEIWPKSYPPVALLLAACYSHSASVKEGESRSIDMQTYASKQDKPHRWLQRLLNA